MLSLTSAEALAGTLPFVHSLLNADHTVLRCSAALQQALPHWTPPLGPPPSILDASPRP